MLHIQCCCMLVSLQLLPIKGIMPKSMPKRDHAVLDGYGEQNFDATVHLTESLFFIYFTAYPCSMHFEILCQKGRRSSFPCLFKRPVTLFLVVWLACKVLMRIQIQLDVHPTIFSSFILCYVCVSVRMKLEFFIRFPD
ncbi:hypothetical protein VNO80_08456 [Phaseolus coccineus]|uniref:Uncharacterized protein n=1 Tax=Phaseolus coccineus TaxID=3886 RepID=A0AAN9N4D7_PHACN